MAHPYRTVTMLAALTAAVFITLLIVAPLGLIPFVIGLALGTRL